ncbi:MAG: type II toxin-antitoxin system HicB family antitoxin, partial [Methanosarcina sp.]
RFTIKLEESEEGGYTAQCLEIPAVISEADTKKEAVENIKEAIQLVLEVTKERAQLLGGIPTVEVPVGEVISILQEDQSESNC